VTLLERSPDAAPSVENRHDQTSWRAAASVGQPLAASPGEGDVDVPVGDDVSLVLKGHQLEAGDRRVLEAFAAQAATFLAQRPIAWDSLMP